MGGRERERLSIEKYYLHSAVCSAEVAGYDPQRLEREKEKKERKEEENESTNLNHVWENDESNFRPSNVHCIKASNVSIAIGEHDFLWERKSGEEKKKKISYQFDK